MTETESVQSDVATQTVEDHASESRKTERDNLVALRKKSELLEQQNYLLQQQLLQTQHMGQSGYSRGQQPQEEIEEHFDFNSLSKDQFPEGEKLAKAFSHLEKKLGKYDKKLSDKDAKIAVLEAAVKYKDFDEVCSTENIKKYIEQDEDNIESVRKAANPGLKIYNLIKKSHAYQSDLVKQKVPPISQEQKKVEEKETKPRTSSVGIRSEAISTVSGVTNSTMTREQKTALWKETAALASKSGRR